MAVGGAAAVGTRAAASSGLAGPGRGAAGRLKRRTGVGLAGGLEPAGELPAGELPDGAAAGLGVAATGGLAVGGEPAGGRLTGGFIVRRAILGRAAVGGRPLSMAEAPGIFGHDGVGKGALYFLELGFLPPFPRQWYVQPKQGRFCRFGERCIERFERGEARRFRFETLSLRPKGRSKKPRLGIVLEALHRASRSRVGPSRDSQVLRVPRAGSGRRAAGRRVGRGQAGWRSARRRRSKASSREILARSTPISARVLAKTSKKGLRQVWARLQGPGL